MTTPAGQGGGVVMTAVTAPAFRCTLTHGPSRTEVRTEAPKDNGGTGSSFSPTDLLGASLVSCALTTMALVAAREGIPFGEATGTVEKRMVADPHRRVAELPLTFRMPPLSPEHRARMEEIARGCPVARSLHPDVRVEMTFLP
ncbi:MAG: hypothetical protein RL653_4249 [Pseudomonadota bacterium]